MADKVRKITRLGKGVKKRTLDSRTSKLALPPDQEICRLYHVLDDETGDGRGEF